MFIQFHSILERGCNMKKVVYLITCLVLSVSCMSVKVMAASGINAEEQKVLDVLKTSVTVNGVSVSLDASYINSAENYMNGDGVNLTASQANIVIAQIEAAKQVILENNITDLKTMNKKFQDQILGYAKTAAEELGLILVADYSSKTMIIKDENGNIIFTLSKVIKNTGDDYTKALAMSGAIALLLVGAGILAAKKGLFINR